ncbi:MAG: hypothetical protein A2041_11215 [Bacteroidetes bacterium GWA2_31_9b]|nr:MAG: hypothetical protein A2041_11215 [Bacteroidetes bacterium GWA2_31_9b]
MKTIVKFSLPIFLVIILFTKCNMNTNMDQERENILKADIDFSNRSVEVGNHQAFIEFASQDVVLLKPNSYPIVGKEALKQLYTEISDTNYRLTWKPSFARVAKSCDLGYSFGIYLLEITKGENIGQSFQGTYATVWEKNAKGEWRFVLDTGNPGLTSDKKSE